MSNLLKIPALGRSIELGMVYNCFNEQFIPGFLFWDKEEITKHRDVYRVPNTDLQILEEDMLDTRFKSLGVNGELKISLLSKLIEAGEGAANFMYHSKGASLQARMSLAYKATTFIERLNMPEHIVKSPQCIKQCEQLEATHVVTEIVYGADAYFIFDKTISNTENPTTIKANLKLGLSKIIPALKADAGFEAEYTNEKTALIDTFKCTFIGDIELQIIPTNCEAVKDICQKIPELIKQKQQQIGREIYGIPKTITLLPLSTFVTYQSKLLKRLEDNFILEIENIFEGFEDIFAETSLLLNTISLPKFQWFKKQIGTFQENMKKAKLKFSDIIKGSLPIIRKEQDNESNCLKVEFRKKIFKFQDSPFHKTRLETWLEEKHKEYNQLLDLENLQQDHIYFLNDYNCMLKLFCDANSPVVICFNLGRLTRPDLKIFEEQNKFIQNFDSDEDYDNIKDEALWKDEFNRIYNEKLNAFLCFAKNNYHNKDNDIDNSFYFVVLTSGIIKDEKFLQVLEPGTLFEFKDKKFLKFEIPKTPIKINVLESKKREISINWEIEKSIVSTNYIIKIEPSGSNVQQAQKYFSEDNKFNLPNLSPNTSYDISIQAITVHKLCGEFSSILKVKTSSYYPIALKLLENNKLIKIDEPEFQNQKYTWYQITSPLDIDKKNENLRWMHIGKTLINDFDNTKKEKVILLLGETGRGKTTFINRVANYLFGVKYSDHFRLRVVTKEFCNNESESKTKTITAYSFHWEEDSRIDFILTIVDTPGILDTKGSYIIKDLKDFFTTQCERLDAIGVVLPVNSTKLNDPQIKILSEIRKLFSVDITENILIFLTWGSWETTPEIIEVLKVNQFPYSKYYIFENSGMKADIKPSDISKYNWDNTDKSFKDLFKEVENMKPKSLRQMAYLLECKENLLSLIKCLKTVLKDCIGNKLEMKKKLLILRDSNILNDQTLKKKIIEFHYRPECLKPNEKNAIVCSTCKSTCQNASRINNDKYIWMCECMKVNLNIVAEKFTRFNFYLISKYPNLFTPLLRKIYGYNVPPSVIENTIRSAKSWDSIVNSLYEYESKGNETLREVEDAPQTQNQTENETLREVEDAPQTQNQTENDVEESGPIPEEVHKIVGSINCKICKGGCNWTFHKSKRFKYTKYPVEREYTGADIKKIFFSNSNTVDAQEEIIKLALEFSKLEVTIKGQVVKLCDILHELAKISHYEIKDSNLIRDLESLRTQYNGNDFVIKFDGSTFPKEYVSEYNKEIDKLIVLVEKVIRGEMEAEKSELQSAIEKAKIPVINRCSNDADREMAFNTLKHILFDEN